MGDARETEKAPDAFRTISEVADDLELPQHVLRFWESRFTQIKPVKRAGGRRFYRPEDVDLLRGIRHLLYTDGFTIKGAQRVLKDQGVRYVQDLGIEREVASMRSARPARGAGGEGVTFGGLLGLLPRRRGKGRGGDEDALPDLPESAELPLPFPDAEADRDLASEPAAPPMPLREGRARSSRPERRDPAFDPDPRDLPLRDQASFDGPAFGPNQRDSLPARHPEGGEAEGASRHLSKTEPRNSAGGRREPSFGGSEAEAGEPVARRPVQRRDLDQDPGAAPPGRADPRRDTRAGGRADMQPRPDRDADDHWDAPAEPPPSRRAAPVGRTGERVEPLLRPMQRPSRGPASRLALQGDDATPHSPELDDPLLPFLDDFPPAPQVSEPIEDRIRRLKAQDRRPPRPHEVPEHEARAAGRQAPEPGRLERTAPPHEPEEESGPPDDFIPRRASRAVADSRDWLGAERPPERDASEGPLLRDGDWRQTDWVETATWDAREDAGDTHSDGGRDAGWRNEGWQDQDPWVDDRRPRMPHAHRADDDWPAAESPPAEPPAPYRQAPRATEPEYSMNDPERPLERRPFERPPERPRRLDPRAGEPRHESSAGVAPGYPQRGGAERSPSRESYPSDAPGHAAARPSRSPGGWQGEAMRRAIDEEWGEGAPQALPRATRVGPLIGPISEEGEDGFPMPEAEQRLLAERMSSRSMASHPAAPPVASHGAAAQAAPVSPARQQSERGWSAPAAPVESPAAARPQVEPGPRLPREPLRPGPPEQYLPPHLRSEPRVVGQAPVAAPVLSRDDVHRMQSALYELGECRRLMEGLIGPRGAARTGD